MKPYRRILLAVLALVLLAGSLAACQTHAPDAGGADIQSDAAAQIAGSDTLSYFNGSTTLHFTCGEDGTWHWRDDPAFPLKQDDIRRILDTVHTMAAAQPLPEATDPAAYGLSRPEQSLSTTGKSGETLTFSLGSTFENGSVYMTRSDVPDAIYEAPAILKDLLGRSIFDMMVLPQIPHFTADQVRSVTLEGGAGTSVFTRQSDGTWYAGEALADSQTVLALLAEISAASIQSAVDYRPSAGVTGLCGLDSPAAVLTVTYVNTVAVENTFRLTIGGVRGDGYYALVNDDTTIYLIPAAQLTQLLTLAQQGL